jgi:hypothetical protein
MEKNQNKLNLKSEFNCFLASNLIAQFSRQIVVQILGLESLKGCGNLAVRSLFTMFTSNSDRRPSCYPLFEKVTNLGIMHKAASRGAVISTDQ